ncbi:MAG: chemotaxis protein CheW [Betaproteobacteria bacterium]|nr:chemotaxis protein CheW [Betaproteobacteria bacterium]
MALDLSRFAKAFFEEAAEHLAALENLLLTVDLARPDAEALNAIFRAVHSIKGGAAAFGHQALAEFTHEFESILDRVRKGTLPLTKPRVDAFLKAGDAMRRHLAAIEANDAPDLQEMHALLDLLRTVTNIDAVTVFEEVVAVEDKKPPRFAVAIVVDRATYEPEEALADLEESFRGLGELHDFHTESIDATTLRVGFGLDTDIDPDELRESLEFIVPADSIDITANERRAARSAEAPAAVPADDDDGGFGFFEPLPEPAAVAAAVPDADVQLTALADATSIRVNVAKVDQLINLVGELVIAEAMIAQAAQGLDPEGKTALAAAVAQLERNTRDLQDSVLAIRMLPISFVMSRLPRLVRDLADRLGKEVELELVGEDTELDKSVIEKIADPLTHLVRNAIDHGIEPPAERSMKGKPRQGRLTVRAAHQGGSIVISVTDDGAGLDREKILAKAREVGLDGGTDWADVDVWQLVFTPGFSTAAEVTDVSGRGVGMDVVWQNVHALGGKIEIASRAGAGTTMTIRLPLTLAILDGMLLNASGETYILPLASIVQSIQPEAGTLNSVGGAQLVQVRGEYLPVTTLAGVFGLAEPEEDNSLLVVLEDDGKRAALRVDELVGQQQVVLKSLEANYRKVKGVSGATILGDGRVAFILDAPYLVSLAHAHAKSHDATRGLAHAR